jgi:hypothetical protein
MYLEVVVVAGTEDHVVFIFPIVCVQSPDPKKSDHLFPIVFHSPVKKRNMDKMSNIKPQFAIVEDVELPKLTVRAIITSTLKNSRSS